jgi:CheY-like chemotaxis protein/HPt (histidine-containing phosphotransfer) domain-containing protein
MNDSINGLRIVVLLVDDQPFVGAAIRRLLATEPDITLHCCTKATEAIARANEVAPAVILQDLMMPDLDGLSLVRLFRANPATAHTPVIILSGNDDEDSRRKALTAGAHGYLLKLPPKLELVACIRRHATSHQADEQPHVHDRPTAGLEVTLDPLVLAAFRDAGGSPSFMLSLIDRFIQDVELQVATLADAAERRDPAAWKATAHRLKGTSLIMGARRLGALCGQLEKDPQTLAEAAVSPGPMNAINDELGRVRDAFATERESLSR